jgi:hypothetical protein
VFGGGEGGGEVRATETAASIEWKPAMGRGASGGA